MHLFDLFKFLLLILLLLDHNRAALPQLLELLSLQVNSFLLRLSLVLLSRWYYLLGFFGWRCRAVQSNFTVLRLVSDQLSLFLDALPIT